MTRPLIGLTSYGRRTQPDGGVFIGNRETYIASLRRAGATVVLIPPQPDAAELAALAARLDGLVLPGGDDIDPARYGATPHPQTQAPDSDRDATEIALARLALARELPLLGICRGMQVINVALGGTLYQDLADEYPGALTHETRQWDYLAHPIAIAADSRLARVVGGAELRVNSLHHQAVRAVGAGARVVARAPDGVIEAIEIADHPFAIAVQYHPEAVSATDVAAAALFIALIAAAQARSGVAAQVDAARGGGGKPK